MRVSTALERSKVDCRFIEAPYVNPDWPVNDVQAGLESLVVRTRIAALVGFRVQQAEIGPNAYNLKTVVMDVHATP